MSKIPVFLTTIPHVVPLVEVETLISTVSAQDIPFWGQNGGGGGGKDNLMVFLEKKS